jgi:cell shape-determining protein MreC
MISSNPFDRARKSRRRSSMLGIITTVLLLTVLCAVIIFWRNALANTLWQALAPVTALRNKVDQGSIEELRAQLASTSALVADRNALYTQNEVLKSMLNRIDNTKRTLAGVVLRPPASPYDSLLIDAGAREGLVKGQLVFAGGTTAIGEVSEVYTTTSRVQLFSAPGRTYEAQITPTKTPGKVVPVSLQGQGAGSFTGEVPAGSAISVGDSVVIPGLGNFFLGNVAHVEIPDGSSFETLYIQLSVNIFSLQYVEVAKQ